MPSDEISGSQRQNEAISTHRHSEALRGTPVHSEALRCTPRHSGALGSGAITCGILARSSYLSRSLTTSFFAVRRERLTICRSASLRQIRYNQMQSDAIRCHQRQAEAIRGWQIQAETSRDKQMQSETSRGKQRQAETSRGKHLLLGEHAIGQCDEIVLFRAQSALVPPDAKDQGRQAELISEAQSALVPTDAPGHKCRALRHVRRLNHVSQPSHPKSSCNHVQSRAITCNHVQSHAITCNHAPKVLDDPRHASARNLVASAKGATRRDDESLDDVGEGRLARETDDNGREAPEG